jgi:biotin carboxyl carrier protein
MSETPDADPILEALTELLPQLERSGVTELDVSIGETRLYLRRRPGAAAPRAAVPETPAADEDDGLIAISTPLSGVFYAAPAPDAPPYVEEGGEVEAGQTVALVEAMKVFNEIHADVPGTVVKILATSGQLVSSGQALMRIRPSGEALAIPSEAP